MSRSGYCEYCGCELGTEKYWLPISVDEVLLLCYDCNLEENAGIVIQEIVEDEELLQVIGELQEEYEQEEKNNDV